MTASGPKRARERILRTALDCFNRHGFTATTVEQILSESGASIGSLYHHFGRKEQLAATLYLEGLRDYQASAVQALSACRDAERGVRAFISNYVRWIEEKPDWARYLLDMRQTESFSVIESEVDEMNRSFFRRLADWFNPHIEAGRLSHIPAELFGAVLVGPLHEYARLYLAGRTKTAPRDARRILADAAWKALQPTTKRS